MFFQISPIIRKKTKVTVQRKLEDEDSKPEELSLAPFTQNPKILFNNVPVGTMQSRILVIKNPTGHDINLFVKKHIQEEINFHLSWNEALIPKGSELTLEMKWKPISEESSRHTFILSNGKIINRDIAVTFNSIDPKAAKKSGKLKTKSKPVSLPLVPKAISPQNRIKPQKKSSLEQPSPVFKCSEPQSSYKKHSATTQSQQASKQLENKENLSPNLKISSFPNTSSMFVSPNSATFLMENVTSQQRKDIYKFASTFEQRRDTYTIHSNFQQIIETKFNNLDDSVMEKFSDSLEGSPNIILQKSNIKTPNLDSFSRTSRNEATNKFLVSPIDVGDNTFSTFMPQICSSNSKPSSTNNSLEKAAITVSSIYLNGTNETYTKESTVSSATYVKEDSWDSPCSRKCHNSTVKSPVFLKPRALEMSLLNETLRSPVSLSAIAEENGIFTESSLRTGSKRKSTTLNIERAKRERLNEDWAKTGTAPFRFAKTITGLNIKQFNQGSVKISDATNQTLIIKNPFLYANIVDPFMSSAIYVDEEWIDKQEKNFTKWLNALLTPPEELSAKVEVDVARVWQECTKKEVLGAPSKEIISLKYHTNAKLDNLRRLAQELLISKEISSVCEKVCASIEAGRLQIREDKDLHLNLKLKGDIIRLILGYNPLWLRIGLETIYNEIIPLKSNSDVDGLTNFLLERFFKDPYLIKKHKTIFSPKYTTDLKKFVLKKFLVLVYFLDRAKSVKLIPHDPCLFCKNAVEKNSKLVLTNFARETLSAVGDITKFLKYIGYQVTHSQSYIHEFDYAVKHLGGDLRDGVRLTRVMEIIQMRNDLTGKLRVPAISRLQKVHNMQLVFKSLQESGYDIQYDIVPKDIVDGCREKTLSFLWQIIYKFEAPYVTKNATTIQTWYRSLAVVLKRRKLQRLRKTRDIAAQKIQLWYRHLRLSKFYSLAAIFLRELVEERRQYTAALKIQSYIKMFICRKRYLTQRKAILKLQAYSKGWILRHYYKRRIQAALVIQRAYRSSIQIKQAVFEYQQLKKTTVTIQRRIRATLEMRRIHSEFISLKQVIIKIQSLIKMHLARKEFLRKRTAAIVMQKRFRAIIVMKAERKKYISLKSAVLCIQQRFRANIQMRKSRKLYLQLQISAVIIQKQVRMILQKRKYLKVRRSALVIQQKFRANRAMRLQTFVYQELKGAALVIQRRFRARQMCVRQKQQYAQLKRGIVTVQRRFRSKQLMKKLKAAIKIQVWYTSILSMRRCKQRFDLMKKAAITIQRKYRANKLMQTDRINYQRLRSAVILMQTKFRANKAGRNCRGSFLALKAAAITIQRKYRANGQMRKCRESYISLKKAVMVIETRYCARKMTVRDRQFFVTMKTAAITIQTWFRGILIMRKFHQRYIEIKTSCIVIQRWYRQRKEAIKQRDSYLQMRIFTVMIQRKFRAKQNMLKCKYAYLKLKNAVRVIEQRYLAIKEMKVHQTYYKNLKTAAIRIQRIFRAKLLMRQSRNYYLSLRRAAIWIQSRYRAKNVKQYYGKLRQSTIFIQRKFKAKKAANTCRTQYRALLAATIIIQRKFRASRMTSLCMLEYSRIKWAAIVLQRRYRAMILMRNELIKYQRLRSTTILIQRWFKASILCRKQRTLFLQYKVSVAVIEKHYMGYLEMKRQRERFLVVQKSVRGLQSRIKAVLVRRKYVQFLSSEAVLERRMRRFAATKIQAIWKGYSLRKFNPRVRALRVKWQQKPASIHTRTLAQRCDEAMQCFTSGNATLKAIIDALTDLDFVTGHCKERCMNLSYLLPTQLYFMITTMARSLPEMNIGNRAALILINFCKYSATRERCWSEEYLEGLVQVMAHWCDKESPFFCTLATLIWLFAHQPQWKKALVKIPHIETKLYKIHLLVHRKQNMVSKSKRVSSCPVFGHLSGKVLTMPSTDIRWGLDSDRPRTFETAVQAVTELTKILGFKSSDAV
ncbi:protein abnormal spindle [Euwallacea fornicatus]|uniref:protein abnormal spindle n=1 Tax=Euwallacea fornicatus TaxID=995702 RepID=UPI00338D5ABD